MSDSSLFTRPLVALTRGMLRSPLHVIIAGLLIGGAAIAVTVKGLGFKTDRLDLLNPASEFNQRWLAYMAEFGDEDDVLVVGESEDREQLSAALRDLGERLKRQPEHFASVLDQVDLSRLKAKGLHYLPLDDLRRVHQMVCEVEPLATGDWTRWSLGGRLRELAGASEMPPRAGTIRPVGAPVGVTPAGASPALVAPVGSTSAGVASAEAELRRERMARFLETALSESPELPPELDGLRRLSERFAEFDARQLLFSDGRLGMIALRLKSRNDQLVRGGEEIKRLRSLVTQVARRHPQVELGVTGMPVLEYDEMWSSQQDMTLATIVSFVGIIILLLAGFGSWRYTLLAIVTLIVGMAWSFGFVTLVVGHLNILSISFAAILIGLGIDFGIHYLARYIQVRNRPLPRAAAVIETVRSVGPGVITGAVTTACAFFAAGWTDFTGVAELGVIAGGGILLCLAAALFVLPPLLYWIDGKWKPKRAATPLPLGSLLTPLKKAPGFWVFATVALAVVAAPGVSRLRYDHNLLNLQPKYLDSVTWEQRLIERSDRSVWFAVSTAQTPEELLELKRRYERLPTVERTEEIVSLTPDGSSEQFALIYDIERRLSGLPARVPILPTPPPEQLGAMLGQFITTEQARGASPELVVSRLATYHQQVSEQLLGGLHELKRLAKPEPPSKSDLPAALVDRFIGSRSGRHLLRVYAKGDIWEMDRLERFVADIESVDPVVTGHPVQTFYASRQMQRSYIDASFYALAALLVVLLLDFRSLSHSLLALSPLLLAIWLLLGVLGWLDIPLNAANMIVLPLILGIGIDNGVHVVHDWRSRTGRGFSLNSSVATAMLACSSTTMVGFASMVFARHQGLRTLGEVLTIGITCCLTTSLAFLPPLLSLISGPASDGDSAPEEFGATETGESGFEAAVAGETLKSD